MGTAQWNQKVSLQWGGAGNSCLFIARKRECGFPLSPTILGHNYINMSEQEMDPTRWPATPVQRGRRRRGGGGEEMWLHITWTGLSGVVCAVHVMVWNCTNQLAGGSASEVIWVLGARLRGNFMWPDTVRNNRERERGREAEKEKERGELEKSRHFGLFLLV